VLADHHVFDCLRYVALFPKIDGTAVPDPSFDGTGIPTTAGQTTTNLPGFPTSGGSPYGFFFADLDAAFRA
jgi:hypothetical protein